MPALSILSQLIFTDHPSSRAMPPRRSRTAYLVGRRLYIAESLLRELFGLPQKKGLTEPELHKRAAMMLNTMMDYGDICSVPELREYHRRYQPIWTALYHRWVQQKDNPAGTEWACFDMPGKVEFVRRGGDVVELLAMPNQYALGERVE